MIPVLVLLLFVGSQAAFTGLWIIDAVDWPLLVVFSPTIFMGTLLVVVALVDWMGRLIQRRRRRHHAEKTR